ncbi:MAG: hypothetical protein ACI87N_002019 [Flavobacteriales bacterium]|jgi:hypothetical protein
MGGTSRFRYLNHSEQDNYVLTVLKLKNLTLIQQTNNKILTEAKGNISDICSVINWLFIIWFWLVKELPASKDAGIFYYEVFFIVRYL